MQQTPVTKPVKRTVLKKMALTIAVLLFYTFLPIQAQDKTNATTSGTVTVEGNTINYKAVAGNIILKNKSPLFFLAIRSKK